AAQVQLQATGGHAVGGGPVGGDAAVHRPPGGERRRVREDGVGGGGLAPGQVGAEEVGERGPQLLHAGDVGVGDQAALVGGDVEQERTVVADGVEVDVEEGVEGLDL